MNIVALWRDSKKKNHQYSTSTTDELFSALAISFVSVVNFFIRLKLANREMSTSETQSDTKHEKFTSARQVKIIFLGQK